MSALDDLVALATAAGAARAYAEGSVPPNAAYPYMVLSMDTGTAGIRRVGGGATRKSYRMTVKMFGRSDDSVLAYADLADAAFEDKVLGTLPGRPFSIREMQTPIYRDPDDHGVLDLLHTYKLMEG